MLVTDALSRALDRHPQRLAIIDGERQFTYHSFAKAVGYWHRFLAPRVASGDRVGLLFDNCAEFLFVHYACMLVGAVSVPLAHYLSSPNFSRIAETSGMSVLVGKKALVQGKALGIPAIACDEACGFENESIPDFSSPSNSASPALMMFTSGTTGQPKGVVLNHDNLLAAARNINQAMAIGEGEREVVPLPLVHSFGLGRSRCLFERGGTIIIEKGLLRPDKIVDRIIACRATGLSMVPAGFAILLTRYLEYFKPAAQYLNYVEIGSSSMPLPHKKLLMETLPKTRLYMHYGLTEASRSAFIEFHREEDKLESVGRPTPGVRIRVVDGVGTDVPPETVGTVLIAAETVMQCYWGDDSFTRERLVNGWLTTDDLGKFDADGYLYIVGRKGDMMNIGGFKVAATEVETVLNRHPQVVESAVRMSDDMIQAFVVSRSPGLTEKDVRGYCLQNLETWKVPQRVTFIKELPKTSSGKIQKNRL